MALTIVVYYDSKNDLLLKAEEILKLAANTHPHELIRIDVNTDDALKGKLIDGAPRMEIGPYHLDYPFTESQLKMTLGAARDRQEQLSTIDDKRYQRLVKQGSTISGSDKLSSWIANHYMFFFNLLLGMFVGFPFLAPLLATAGWQFPAAVIYKVYSPLCHQMAYRSWFIAGEQLYYPRDLAGITDVLTYEEISGNNSLDLMAARNFIGNDTVGYKVALCERDIAIYGGIFLFGLLFALTGRRIRPIRWYVWVLIGILPMGIDGVSQLPAIIAPMADWLPIRESTPWLRTITGLLFGITTAWYGYPLIEETMLDTRRVLVKKNAVVQQRRVDNAIAEK